MFSNKKGIKFVCSLLICTLLLPMVTDIGYATETKEHKKVRIGYMMYDGFQHGAEGEPKSGSAYEYYQKLRYYTGWEYEYVYGSISEMFEKLETGDIDIMAAVTYTDERAEKYLFSDEPHGSEAYFLYTRNDNTTITPADLSTLNGKNIGITLGSYQEQYFANWCKEHSIDCNIKSYAYIDDMHTALTNKEIDAMVDVRILDTDSDNNPWKSIYRFKSESLYFAVNKNRPDILKELNDAQAYIVSTDEYFSNDVMQKYHDGVNYYNTYLTKQQEQYLNEIGTIKVGYLEGTNPLAFTDKNTGKMSGLCADYLDAMSIAYGINFETFVYTNETALIEDLSTKKLDIIVPIGMGYWAAEQSNIALSSSIYSLPMTAVYKNLNAEKSFSKIAVIKNSPTQEGYAMQYYPNAELYYYDSSLDALHAIENGEVDCYFVRSSSMDYLNSKYQVYDSFRTTSVLYNMEAFMATRIDDTTLCIILDKGISLLTDAQRESAKLRYEFETGKLSLLQAVKDNSELVFGIIIIVILIFTLLIFVLRFHSNLAHMKSLEQEKEKAQKAERAKTEFLSQMSHDIRTPMNAIIGFTNFIKEENNIDVIKNDYVPKIETASNHLLLLINDVLEMSRIDTGRLVFTRSVHDIHAIIDSIVTVMHMQAEENNLELTKDICVSDGLVYTDQNHLSRVLINLLSNAVKFTPSGGQISISVHQTNEAPEGYVNFDITIKDTGIGISPEFIDRVFEPFERERTSTISGLQGTGLGLAIVKNIVDTAGDTITVESTPGEGTCFTLNITLMKATDEHIKAEIQEEKRSPEELRDFFKGRRILLVEDNDFNSTIAYAILENAGFLVETAENGQIAVHKVQNAPVPDYYDVILMDIQMPIMDGYEATKAIRNLPDERSAVKIIAVTANAFETDKDIAMAAGMNGHISKPLDVNILYQTLLNLTRNK